MEKIGSLRKFNMVMYILFITFPSMTGDDFRYFSIFFLYVSIFFHICPYFSIFFHVPSPCLRQIFPAVPSCRRHRWTMWTSWPRTRTTKARPYQLVAVFLPRRSFKSQMLYVGVSINGGYPKMVGLYWKIPSRNGWFGGYLFSRKPPNALWNIYLHLPKSGPVM